MAQGSGFLGQGGSGTRQRPRSFSGRAPGALSFFYSVGVPSFLFFSEQFGVDAECRKQFRRWYAETPPEFDGWNIPAPCSLIRTVLTKT